MKVLMRNYLGHIASIRSVIFTLFALASFASSAFNTPYLTFRSSASFSLSGTSSRWTGDGGYLEYATSNPTSDRSWATWTGSYTSAVQTDGQYYIYLRGKGIASFNPSGLSSATLSLSASKDVYCEGDIETLRGYDGDVPTMGANCYKYMFYNWTKLVSAPVLSATTLANNCYDSMFYFAHITNAPALPAETLANNCYRSMFSYCSYMTSAPTLPAMTMTAYCYESMFSGCSSLVAPPALPATTLASSCYQSMFQGCTSLKSLPALPATTAASSCYQNMFSGCTALEVNTSGPGVTWSIPSEVGLGASLYNSSMFANTSGSFTGNPEAGTPYKVASALSPGEIYQVAGGGTLTPTFSGVSHIWNLSATVKNGTAPYTFEHVGGTLPPGLEVSGSTLSGIPTTPGTYNFTLKVTDAESHVWNDAPYSLNILQKTIVPVTFVDATGTSVTTNCIELNTGIIIWDEEWYVATGTLNYGTGGITVSGDANLVLADGASLTVVGASKKSGVNVASGNSLTIFGQTGGTGYLTASGNSSDGYSAGGAGIGGNDHENCGTITINGGNVTANGGNYVGAGIGGGYYGNGGTVTINGGTVTATGGSWYGAGIGGGNNGNGGDVTINGGTVTATAGSSDAGSSTGSTGIGKGRGYSTTKGTLTVGPAVSVKAGSTANPTTEIGRGGSITIGTQRYFYVETLSMTQIENSFASYAGESKEWNLAETIVGGVTPYTFSGTVPSGLTLNSNGTLSGAVAAAGSYPFTLTVTDGAEDSKNFTYTLTVTAPDPITETQTSLSATVGKAKAFDLIDTVSGGVPPYTFALASGSNAPDGFTLVDGVLSGTAASAVDSCLFTVVVTDAVGTTKNVAYTLTAAESSGFIDDDPEEPSSGDSVDCRTADGVVRSRTCKLLTSSSTVWNNSWYYVAPNTTLSIPGVVVNGKVSLILGDGATLTVQGASSKAGIRVAVEGSVTNSLTIYCQGAGTGKLVAKGGSASAGIGGDNKTSGGTGLGDCGKVTIYGGVIEATGDGDAAGIGGGDWYGKGGTIAIYGGTVTASAGSGSAAGVGRGYGSSTDNGTLTVGERILVKAGATANPTAELPHGENGSITLSSQRYFTFETTGPAPLAQTTSAFAAYIDDPFEVTLADTVSGGTTPYTFVQKSGTLPTGLSFADGVISGTPTAAGSATVVFTVSDSGTGADAQSTDFTYTITVTAKPKKITYYNGAVEITGLTPSNYVESVGATLAATAPAATGYTFAGWYGNSGLTGDAVTAIDTEATGDKEFWAKWTPVVYTITYKDGASPMAGLTPTNYTIEAAATLPESATKSGYGFYGWYTNSTFTGSAVTTIPAGSTGDKTFYAKWGAAKSNENYIDASGTPQIAECIEISSSLTTLDAGWYVVKGSVTNNNMVTVSGDVKLILADGATLTVNAPQYNGAITVQSPSKLTVFGQTLGTGTLNANVSIGWGPAIGSKTASCGDITINGGVVNASGHGGAGIGGGYGVQGGTVVINGGTVTATADSYGAAGIGGGGNGAAGGIVTINGGTVRATGGDSSGTGGIGGANTAAQGSLTVGANVVVKAGSSATLTDADIQEPVAGVITLGGQQYFFVQDMGPVELAQTTSALSALTGGAKNWTLADTIKGGTPPYSFAVKAGAEPPSFLSLVDGVLSGTPTAATVEPYAFTIVVTDDASDSIEATYTLTVVDPPALVATQTALGTVAKNTAVNYNLSSTVSGGIAPYSFAVKSGSSLPAGLSLDNGVISGAPSTAGNSSFTIVVTDSASPANSIEVGYTLVVKEVYSITYYNGESTMTLSPSSYVEGTGATLPTPSRTGFTFIGWHVSSGLQDAVVRSISSSDTGAKVFYAEWEEDISGSVSMKYIDADGSERTEYCTVLESGNATLSAGRYVLYNSFKRTSKITISGDVELVLKDGASLDVTVSSGPAIEVKGSAKLTIYGQANGTGALTATSTLMGPAIGSNDSAAKCGTIIINGGTVTATGNAAGIGGGSGKEGGTVVINGGTVMASSDGGATGIGGGSGYTTTGSLTVGEYVTVTAGNSAYAMAVKPRAPDGTITLGGERYYKAVTKRPVSIAYIDADGTEKSAICTEVSADCRNMSNGWYAVTSDVNLGELGMTVSGSVNLVLVDGASLVVTGAYSKAGINVPTNTVLTIYGQAGGTGALYATGSGDSAGIGGNSGSSTDHYAGSAGKIVINGGVVVAVGQGYGTGIGGGGYGNGGDVTVNGGDVTATGGSALGMGIGQGGWLKNGGSDGVLKIASTMVARAGTTGPDNELEADAETGIVTIPAPGTFALRYFTVKSKSAVLEEYSIIYYKEWSSALNEWVAFSGLMPNKYSVGEGAELPSEPNATKTGYTFAGWYTNSTFTGSAITAIPADATGVKYFYAKWAPNVYDIVYIGPDGETPVLGLVPSNYTYSTTSYLDLASPSGIPGYTFGGWYKDAGHSEHASWVSPSTTGTQTFYGKWTLEEYTITYKDGDTTLSGLQPAAYTMSSEALALPAEGPEKEGYTFAGWTLDSAGAGDAMVELAAGSYGNKTFYVKWTPVEYPITYMDGAVQMTGLVPSNYTAAAATQLPDATKAGSFFIGWYTNSTFTGSAVSEIPAGQTGEKTFYARWSGSSSVSFVDADGVEMSETCAEVAPSMTTWSSGWYVVSEDTEINSSVTVQGDVNLVLADDVTLTVADTAYSKAGILVPWGHSLTIYAQAKGTGALIASAGSAAAGIGGCRQVDCGRIVVNGGTVITRGGNGGAGIGGGNEGDGGDVFLNGGGVTAYGGGNAPGIGAGFGGASQGTLTLGDNVTLDVSEYLDSKDPTKPQNPVTICVGGEVELYGDMRYFRAEKGAQASPSTYLAFTSPNPFTIEVEGAGWLSGDGELRYSLDAVNWLLWDGSLLEAANVGNGYALYFRGTGNAKITSSLDARWVIDGSEVSCTGDVETLRDWRGNPPAMAPRCFSGMFYGCSALVSAPTLSRLSLAESAYSFMFRDCVNLTNIPVLPATHLGSDCYNHMFDGCTSLRVSESGPGTVWSLPDEVRESYIVGNSDMFKDTGGSFTGSPTNSLYYVKGANDLDMPIQHIADIYAAGPDITLDLRTTLSGGSGDWTFETVGDVPAGLSLDAGVLRGALSAGHAYSLGIRVTDAWFGKSVDLSYTLHTVTTIPEFSQSTQALGPYGAHILADSSLTNTLSGYIGTCRFVETPGTQNKIPVEVELLEDGRFYINGKLAAGEYAFDVTVTDGALRSLDCTYVLTITPNALPVIDAVSPSDAVVTIYGGEQVTFSVTAHDPEGQDMVYYWYLDGAILGGVGGLGPSYTYSYSPLPDGSVDKPMRTLQCRVWDRHNTVIAKSWTIDQPGWRYEITTDTLPAATTGVDYMVQLAGVGHGGEAEWYLAEGDRLPPGLAMDENGAISGRARMAGSYVFTVLREEGNAIVSKEFTIEVTGENAAPTIFNVASDAELKALAGKTIPGDVIVIADGTEVDNLDVFDYPETTFKVTNGTVTFVVDVRAPFDARNLVVEAGASAVFKAIAASPYFGHYDLVQMPATIAGTWSVDAPFFLAAPPAVDSDGVLGFDALGGKDANDTLTVLFPDGPAVRDHELADFETTGGLVYRDESSVDGVSVLGSTLTLTGANSFGGAISQTEGYTAIVLEQGASLDIGSVYELGGYFVLAEGSSFTFGAPAEGVVVSNAVFGGTIVPPSSGTANLVLKDALHDGESVTVFDFYAGAAASFQLVLPDGADATHYSLVCEDGRLVVKCGAPLHEDDSGTLNVTGDDSFDSSYDGSISGNMVTASGGTAPYTWTCPYATYDITRAANSFDGAAGAAELAIRQRLATSTQRNIVDIGFDFPFGGYLQNQVAVGLNGCISVRRGNSETGRICLFGDDAPDFVTANDIFVVRSAITATIRFGQRASVTLVSDGTIRVAYGPLAEGAERRYMPCDIEIKDKYYNFNRVARFEAENGVYNGIGDVVFTQTSVIPGGLSPSANGNGMGLSGKIGAPNGSYPVKFRCVDANGYVIEKTVTVNVVGGNSSLVKSTANSPAAEADGACHIQYGDSQTFSVAGIDPSACRWYEDNVQKASGVLSYTFDSSTGPWPVLSTSVGDLAKHTKLVTCRVLDPLYGGQELTVASWQVIVNATYYIDASVVDSAADGTQAHPFRTVPTQLSGPALTTGAFPGDVFLFRPGKYKVPFVAPADFAVTLRSTGGADVTLITIDSASSACVMQSGVGGTSRAMRVEGFTLVNAGGRAAYGGTLVNCVLRDSALGANGGVSDDDIGYGGGAYGSRLVNCLVSNCSAVYGGGVAASELRNCTVVCNIASGQGGALDGASVAYNTVFWGNRAGEDGHDSNATERTPVPGYILPLEPTTYSCLYAEDPMLYADGRPAVGSPCLGAGNAAYLATDVAGALTDLAGDERNVGGIVSIGAYENAVATGACRIMVSSRGAGTVLEAPYADVEYGSDATFRFRGRLAAVVYTNGVLAAENVSSYVWPSVTQPGELSVTFTATDLYVDIATGSFDNDGLSWDTPKYDINDALKTAGDGDVIHVKPGRYGNITVTQISKLSDIKIVSTEGRDVTIIDAQHIAPCFDVSLDWVKNDAWERHGIVLEGFTLQNGHATGYLGGGGACGGTLINCIIQNCESIGQFTSADTARGGGASGSVLINCIVRNCRAGKAVSDGTWYSSQAEGGGVWGGSAEKCEIYGNSCWGETRSEGPGTYDTVLRDCYVYNNKIGTYAERETVIPAADAALNTAGEAVEIRVVTREPTAAERADTTERIPVGDSRVYETRSEAEAAALNQLPDITIATASSIAADRIDVYTEMFEIKTVQNKTTGVWENAPELKDTVVEELRQDLTDALGSLATTESLTELGTGVTEFVLDDPKPGLYYAIEFTESLGGRSVFAGPRYLSDGHSVKLAIEHHDSPAGFWRMSVYKTPTGE